MASTSSIRSVFDRITRGEFSEMSDDDINWQIGQSQEYADEDILGTKKFTEAIANHAAHQLKSSPSEAGSGGGKVKRKKNGPREIEFFQTSRSESSYSGTGYGDRYEQIISDTLAPFEII